MSFSTPIDMLHYGILAHPVSHSQSPQMHTAAFKHRGVDAVFKRYDISPESLNTFFDQNFKKARNIEGLAVSIPYKETVIEFLDKTDESAQKIGAVNTVYWKEKRLCGTNTDWIGFSQSLAEQYDVEAKKVLILGAGGVARSIIFALREQRADQIIIVSKTENSAAGLAHEFGVQWKKPEALQPEEYQLVINTTPLGMMGKYEKISPLPQDFWRSHLTAFDAVYTPEKTRFLRDAELAGSRIISGKNMFLYQGMEQFKIWIGKNAPEKVMQNAIS